MSQTSYPLNQPEAVAGNLADVGNNDIISRSAEAALVFGLGVMVGTDKDKQAKVLTSGVHASNVIDEKKFLGVTVRDLARENLASSTNGYETYDTAAIIRKGRVYVKVEEAVTTEDPVYVRHTTGTGTVIGAFRKSADTNTAALLTNARWDKGASANGFAVLSINLA